MNNNNKIIGYDPQTGQPIYEIKDMQNSNAPEKSKNKTLIIVLSIIGSTILLVGGMFIYCVFKFINIAQNGVKDVINSVEEYVDEEKKRDKLYDNIISDVLLNVDELERMTQVRYYFEETSVFPDKTTRYYEFTDKTQCGSYDYDEQKYEYCVKYIIRISDISYKTDYDYANVHLSKDKVYYLVEIYNIYDQSILQDQYYLYDKKSLIKQYIYYEKNDKLVREQVYM